MMFEHLNYISLSNSFLSCLGKTVNSFTSPSSSFIRFSECSMNSRPSFPYFFSMTNFITYLDIRVTCLHQTVSDPQVVTSHYSIASSDCHGLTLQCFYRKAHKSLVDFCFVLLWCVYKSVESKCCHS